MQINHLHLHVADVDRAAAFGRRAEIVAPPSEQPDFVWFRCCDPDGHAIEVYREPQPG